MCLFWALKSFSSPGRRVTTCLSFAVMMDDNGINGPTCRRQRARNMFTVFRPDSILCETFLSALAREHWATTIIIDFKSWRM